MRRGPKTLKANRKLHNRNQRLHTELKELRYIANTFYHHAFDYNKWVLVTSRHLKYVDAQALLKNYFQRNPY